MKTIQKILSANLNSSCIRNASLYIVLIIFLISGIFTPVNSQQIVFGDFGDVKVINPDGSGLQTIHTFPFDPITTDVVTNPTDGIVYILSEQGGSDWNINEIGTMNIDGTGEYETLINLSPQFGLGLALDYANEKIYWLDQGSNHRVMRANLDGTGVEELLSSDNNPTIVSSSLRNIVVDLFSEKIYWSTAVDANASDLGTIRFADLDGSNPGLLISGEGSNEMESIAIHIDAGKIYWLRRNPNPQVRRANLADGSSIETVLSGLNNPREISLNPDDDLMYVTELSLDKIIQSSIEPGGTPSDLVTGLSYPRGVDYFNQITLTAPVVTTNAASNITTHSADLDGNVTDNGNLPVIERGIVWGFSVNPDLDDNVEQAGTGTGAFSSTINLLPFGTEIFHRAYAINNEGTAYGAEESFTTGDTVSAELTGEEGWRLLAVPAGVSLETFLAPIWTQGVTTGGDTEFGEPNVYTWNLTATGNDSEWWNEVTDLTNTTLSAGQGVLVKVFDDDNYDGTPDGFPKTLPVTGSEYPAPITSPPLNTNTEGWTLMGNPFGTPLNWDNLARTNINNAIYIWDPNEDTHDGGQPATEDAGSWITRSNGAGDFDGIVAPFQGFFVQNSASGTPAISFTQADKTTDVPAFYGKQSPDDDPIVRLELSGQGMSNSVWLRFSPEGSMEPVAGEAWQLQPLSANYALLASQKTDRSLVDIGHYPVSDELEIPLVTEATRPGSYTIKITDYEVAGMQLYLNDLHTAQSLRLKEGARYEFTLNHAAKGPADPFAMLKGDIRKSSTGNYRFTISTAALADEPGNNLPDRFALDQNYPNPFNPSTVIRYQLPESSNVRLEVFDMTGRQVATLINGQVTAGTHSVNFDASTLSSGVYMYRLSTPNQLLMRKMTLIK